MKWAVTWDSVISLGALVTVHPPSDFKSVFLLPYGKRVPPGGKPPPEKRAKGLLQRDLLPGSVQLLCHHTGRPS